MTKYFGTDGVRGRFGAPPLDRKSVTALAGALGRHLRARAPAAGAPSVLLGGDTRESTPEISRWLTAGLDREAIRVYDAGVVPTPAIAWMVPQLGVAAGVVISASHNPHHDNGIKLLDSAGFKWSPEAEAALEAAMEARLASDSAHEEQLDLGEVAAPVPTELTEPYLAALRSTLPDGARLEGLSIVLDCGNGAASALAPKLFRDLGARVETLHDAPNGRNINLGCGSTHPEVAAESVSRLGFDLGFSFDGDADRAILVDEHGEARDGDAILYLWATSLAARGELVPPRIVATSMSNLGLEHALAARGIGVERCGVGDREVVETLRSQGLVLGGEQSGHVVHLGLSSTGDGMLTALQVAYLVASSGRTVRELLSPFRRFPQILRNLRVARKEPFERLPRVQSAITEVERELGQNGRLVLRYSGTEPLARIMIEGPDQAVIDEMATRLARVIDESLGEESVP